MQIIWYNSAYSNLPFNLSKDVTNLPPLVQTHSQFDHGSTQKGTSEMPDTKVREIYASVLH